MNWCLPCQEVERWTRHQRKSIASRIARYSGLKELVVQENNLDVSFNLFWKERLRDQGYTVGRLDSRYRGIDRRVGGDKPDYNAELTAWLQAFTPAIHIYLRDELNYKTDLKYNMFGNVHPWDRKDDQTGRTCGRPLLRIPSCICWYSQATTMGHAITSMPNTVCGRWTRVAN